MALIVADRVQETSTTTGTGNLTLGGAVTGFQAFSSVLSTGDTTYYTIADQGGANWEVGLGTFTSPSTLARTTILSSSNAGSAVNFTAGSKAVFITYPAGRSVLSNSSGVVPVTAGGTNAATLTANNVLLGNGTSAVQFVAPSTSGNVLTSNGTSWTSATASPTNGYRRNRIINGGMQIDQRNAGESQTFTAAAALAYSVDRFYGYCTGANVTGARVAGSSINQYRYQFTGAASVTAIGFGQRIEAANSYDLNNGTAYFSVDLANSLLTTVTWTAYYANAADTFGSLASPTRTQIATGTFTVTSTITNYTASISIPAAATTGIEIVLTVGAQTSGTWTIGNLQIEAGSVATPFERLPIGETLALCQRYYWSLGRAVAIGGATAAGYGFTALIPIEFKVTMRTTPSVAFPLGSSTNITIAGTQNAGPGGCDLFVNTNGAAANYFNAVWNSGAANAEL